MDQVLSTGSKKKWRNHLKKFRCRVAAWERDHCDLRSDDIAYSRSGSSITITIVHTGIGPRNKPVQAVLQSFHHSEIESLINKLCRDLTLKLGKSEKSPARFVATFLLPETPPVP